MSLCSWSQQLHCVSGTLTYACDSARVDTAETSFLGLGILVLSLDGKAKSQKGSNVKQAMAVISTLWPIIFAAVLGPMLKAVALYRAERGTKLGVSVLPEFCYTSLISIQAPRDPLLKPDACQHTSWMLRTPYTQRMADHACAAVVVESCWRTRCSTRSRSQAERYEP